MRFMLVILFTCLILQGCSADYRIQKKIINNELEEARSIAQRQFSEFSTPYADYKRRKESIMNLVDFMIISEEYKKLKKENSSPRELFLFGEYQVMPTYSNFNDQCDFDQQVCDKVFEANEINKEILWKAKEVVDRQNKARLDDLRKKDEEKMAEEKIKKEKELEEMRERERLVYLEQQRNKQIKQRENEEKRKQEIEKERKIKEQQELELKQLMEYCGSDYQNIYIGMSINRLQKCGGPFGLKAQTSTHEGVVSVYEQGTIFNGITVHVIDQKVVSWVTY